jgi:hypothetical protein
LSSIVATLTAVREQEQEEVDSGVLGHIDGLLGWCKSLKVILKRRREYFMCYGRGKAVFKGSVMEQMNFQLEWLDRTNASAPLQRSKRKHEFVLSNASLAHIQSMLLLLVRTLVGRLGASKSLIPTVKAILGRIAINTMEIIPSRS